VRAAADEDGRDSVTTELPPPLRDAGESKQLIPAELEQERVKSSANPLMGSICMFSETGRLLVTVAVAVDRCKAKSGPEGAGVATSRVAAALLKSLLPGNTAVK
jgi:hypothetical protein